MRQKLDRSVITMKEHTIKDQEKRLCKTLLNVSNATLDVMLEVIINEAQGFSSLMNAHQKKRLVNLYVDLLKLIIELSDDKKEKHIG